MLFFEKVDYVWDIFVATVFSVLEALSACFFNLLSSIAVHLMGSRGLIESERLHNYEVFFRS